MNQCPTIWVFGSYIFFKGDKMVNDYGILLIAYDKLHRGELTKRQFVEIVKDRVKKSPFLHIGANGACYYQYVEGAFNPKYKKIAQKKDALWLSGDRYDFMFIRFERANRKQVITFLETAHKRSARLIMKER